MPLRAGVVILFALVAHPAPSQDSAPQANRLAPYVTSIRAATQRAIAKPGGDLVLNEALRAALAVARKAPDPARGSRDALVALCWFVDPATPLTRNVFWRRFFRGLETQEEARARARLVSGLTLRGRRDLALHFLTSAAVRVLAGRAIARQSGVGKELADAQELDRGRGEGFSLADLCADEAGLAFAELLLEDGWPKRIPVDVSLQNYMPTIEGLDEGIGLKKWRELYGGVADPRFQTARESLRQRIRALSSTQRR